MGTGSRVLRRWSLEAVVVALVLAFATARGAAGESLTVTQFSPQGVVKQVRQVIARFSQPMVSFGDPRVADPFEIDCAEPGAGRWVDSRTWAYDFKRDLPAGVRCRFQLRSGLTSPTGKTVSGQQTFTFSTGGPAILSSIPSAGGESIEEEQAFVLNLDAEATESSILAHAGFSIEGLPQRAGVRLMTGAARDAILKTFWRGALSEHVVVLQARQRFPNGAKVRLQEQPFQVLLALLERRGYRLIRRWERMLIEMDEPPEPPALPAGVRSALARRSELRSQIMVTWEPAASEKLRARFGPQYP